MSELSGKDANDTVHFQPMPPSKINRLVQNYKDSMTDDDTQSVWFSVSSLQAFINDNQATGIRIYYGRHDKDDALYPGRHNVILVATTDAVTPEDPCCETSLDKLDQNKEDNPGDGKKYLGMGMDCAPMCPPRCVIPPPPAPPVA